MNQLARTTTRSTFEDMLAEGMVGHELARFGEGWELGRGRIAGTEAELADDLEDEMRFRFLNLWDSINGKRAPWASNPMVWAVTFRRFS